MNDKTRCMYEKLDRMGIVHPAWTIELARQYDIPVSLLASILFQESGGGRNVFGHDPFLRPTSYLNYLKGKRVSRFRYRYYKRMRKAGHGMQGVGPMQLTWFAFQDEADRLGGAYRPYINMKVGAMLLAEKLRRRNLTRHQAVASYNGAGAAADRYATQVLKRMDSIHDQLKVCV